jgi:hypothetical protein
METGKNSKNKNTTSQTWVGSEQQKDILDLVERPHEGGHT